ncbi:MAG: tRNA epoxyqueuosine(34) reductase QueG [Planctomycetota bacterium]|nr:tRNA epoxyqueuosine(34) reductase QueG [Planctomycetota bacterium]
MLDSGVIKEFLAQEFELIGICPAVTPAGLSKFNSWLDAGYAGEMSYLPDRRDAYAHPSSVLDNVRSIVMLGSKYANQKSITHLNCDGKIARYARSGLDYHDVIHGKLKSAKQHFESLDPKASFRGVVDTAPLLEREFAQLAGLGWQGKNTMLISKTDGSWFFLSALLTDLELEYDQPFEAQHCGSCTACLDACPTDAFVEPFVMNGSKCISYFNIESQSLPSTKFRHQIGNWLFGCDVCQEVCPWNQKSTAYISEDEEQNELTGDQTGLSIEEIHELFKLDEPTFRRRFRKTPFWGRKRRGILRIAAIVLGNQTRPDSIPILIQGLNEQEPLIRAACVWALGEFNGEKSRIALSNLMRTEINESVLTELNLAIRK